LRSTPPGSGRGTARCFIDGFALLHNLFVQLFKPFKHRAPDRKQLRLAEELRERDAFRENEAGFDQDAFFQEYLTRYVIMFFDNDFKS